MEKLVCKTCGKVIEGYNKNHVDFLMNQHKMGEQCKKRERIIENTKKLKKEGEHKK